MKKLFSVMIIGVIILTCNIQAQGTLETRVEYHDENPVKTYKKPKKNFSAKVSKARDAIAKRVANIDKKKIKAGGKKALKLGKKVLKVRKSVKKKVIDVIKTKLSKSK